MLRATAVWLGILGLASVNGAIRDLLVAPQLGDTIARALSTVVLCLAILLVAWLTIRWIRPTTLRAALGVGGWWLGLTLAFELLIGHYVLHKPWATLLEDYNIAQGRIWMAVLITTLLAPLWAAQRRGLLG